MNAKILFLMLPAMLTNALFGTPLGVGAPAPSVTASDHRGEPVDLGEALASGTTLVFFYPKAHTGGCTMQVCSLRDAWDELKERNLEIYGVSSDTAKTQASFKAKHQLPFTLIADTERKVSQAFGKNRWSRQAYIFKNGKLVWRDLRASTRHQAKDVLAALDAMQRGK